MRNRRPNHTVGRIPRKLAPDGTVTFERLDAKGFDRMRIPGYAHDVPND